MTRPASSTLAVRVTPRAAQDAIEGWQAGRLAIRTTAPPVAGAANAAVSRLLASVLRVPASAVWVVRGQRARNKLVHIEGLGPDDVASRLASAVREPASNE